MRREGFERGECIPSNLWSFFSPSSLQSSLSHTHIQTTWIWEGLIITPQCLSVCAHTRLHVCAANVFFFLYFFVFVLWVQCLLVCACVCLHCWMQISESPKQNAFQIPSPLRSALPLPECSAARHTGKECGQCVVVGDWLCYWPTIYSLTSCFPLCLSPLSLDHRFVCLSRRIVVYVNTSPCPSVHLSPSSTGFVLVIVASLLRQIHKLCIFLWALFSITVVTATLLNEHQSRRKYKQSTRWAVFGWCCTVSPTPFNMNNELQCSLVP